MRRVARSRLGPLHLDRSLPRRLSLLENPVARHPSYRQYVIAKLGPALKSLDYKKVGEKERTAAKEAFAKGGLEALAQTAPPPPPEQAGAQKALKNLTDSQKAAIRAAVAAAQTPEEVDKLERQLKAGIIPSPPPPPTSPPSQPNAAAADSPHPPSVPPPAPASNDAPMMTAAPAAPAAEPADEPMDEDKPEETLTVAQVGKMTVAQLKEALAARDLELTGLKAVLKKRLLEAIA